jgi:hypothetical protein
MASHRRKQEQTAPVEGSDEQPVGGMSNPEQMMGTDNLP